MRPLLRQPLLFRLYPLLPHRALNRGAAWLAGARHPRRLVDAAVRAWIRRGRIDMGDVEDRARYSTVEQFFLRRLRAGTRPLGEGLVSPVDGFVMAAGAIHADTILQVKGRPLLLQRLVNGGRHRLPLDRFEGGTFINIFLTPGGYHFVHMPADGEIDCVQWIPGRFFPQNADALRHIRDVYGRNERAVLRVRLPATDGPPDDLLVVMIGASLVGGIHLAGLERRAWARPQAQPVHLTRRKGDELGHFTFGSTVVLLVPRGRWQGPPPAAGRPLRMGEMLGRLAAS